MQLKTDKTSLGYSMPTRTAPSVARDAGRPRPQHNVTIALSKGSLPLALESSSDSCDALDSEDFVYSTVPLKRAAALQYQRQPRQQLQQPQIHLDQISLAAAEHCYPWISTAYLMAAVGLLTAPQYAVQVFGTASSVGSGAAAAADPLLVSFAQLLGGGYLLQAAVAVIVKGCAERGQLNGTTCQRLLLASLLAMTGNIMSLGKVAFTAASAAPAVWLTVLLATFCAHVACHVPHHPWFLVKVLWPVATTMVITDILHLLPAVMGSGSGLAGGRLQTLLAALLSVKAISKLFRFVAGAAPRVVKRVLGPAAVWLAKCSPRLLPFLAKQLGKAAPRITRIAGRLAGRMAPRYVKDKFTGHTMQMAFHAADTGMTQIVAKSIDLLPPKTPAGILYTVLLAFQLSMIASAYCPGLLFRLPAAEAAVAAATSPVVAAAAESTVAAAVTAAATAAVATEAAVGASTAAAAAGVAGAEVAAGISDPLLRLVKYAWGSGFFIAAFGCNCLKTAADRHHSWGPQNRQLAVALGAMQAVTAWVLYTGVSSGTVIAGPYTWCSISLAAAGACVCCYQAATTSSAQQWMGSAPNSAAGSFLASSSHNVQWDSQQPAAVGLVWSHRVQQPVLMNAAGAAALSAAATAECSEGLPLSSAECEKREHAEPEYAALTSSAVLLLTLLQLAL